MDSSHSGKRRKKRKSSKSSKSSGSSSRSRKRSRVREASKPEFSITSALLSRLTPTDKGRRKLSILDKVIIYVVLVVCISASTTAILIWKSRTAPDLEWSNLESLPEVLTPPPCVSSEAPPDSKYFIEAFECTGSSDYAIDKIELMLKLNDTYRHIRRNENQVQAVASTPKLGFQEDVIFQARTNPDRIEIYSTSRVGIIDFDSNRNRLEEMRELLRSLRVVK